MLGGGVEIGRFPKCIIRCGERFFWLYMFLDCAPPPPPIGISDLSAILRISTINELESLDKSTVVLNFSAFSARKQYLPGWPYTVSARLRQNNELNCKIISTILDGADLIIGAILNLGLMYLFSATVEF